MPTMKEKRTAAEALAALYGAEADNLAGLNRQIGPIDCSRCEMVVLLDRRYLLNNDTPNALEWFAHCPECETQTPAFRNINAAACYWKIWMNGHEQLPNK